MTSAEEVVSSAGDLSCLTALGTTEEKVLVRCLFNFSSSMHAAAAALDPAKICNSVFALAQAFNTFYKEKGKNPIKDCKDEVARQARLLLTEAAGTSLRSGLALLGIDTVETM